MAKGGSVRKLLLKTIQELLKITEPLTLENGSKEPRLVKAGDSWLERMEIATLASLKTASSMAREESALHQMTHKAESTTSAVLIMVTSTDMAPCTCKMVTATKPTGPVTSCKIQVSFKSIHLLTYHQI